MLWNMAPKILRRLKKKSLGHAPSLLDHEEISDQIRNLLGEREKLYEILRTRDESIYNMHTQIAEMKTHFGELQSTIASTADELHATKTKLFEALNQNTQLKNDVKLALKCVQRETGDESLTLAQLASAQSTWRGRAQQICTLQLKIAELRSHVAAEVQSPEADQKVQQLRRVDAQRKLELELVQGQLADVGRELDELRQKWNAQRVRIRILQDEGGALRTRVSGLCEKSARDDANVAQLRAETAELENKLQSKLRQMDEDKGNSEEMRTQMQSTIEQLLRNQTEKDARIAALEQQNADVTTDLKMACGDFLFSCRDLRKDEYMAIVDVLQSEKEGLLQQVGVLQQRLDEQRQRVDGLQESLRRQSIKYSRLEFKYNECVKEQTSLKARNRRSQRIAEYVKNGQPQASASTKSTNVDSSVSSLSFVSNASSADFQMNYQIVDLKNKLDIQTERVRMLQDQIAELQLEKDKDDELYRSIIAKSKSEFAEMLSKQRNRAAAGNNSSDELGSASFGGCGELSYQPASATLRTNTARSDMTQMSSITTTHFQAINSTRK